MLNYSIEKGEKSDYQLIKEIKENINCLKNYEVLYKRYYRMIKKHAFSIRICTRVRQIDKDFIQDAYFYLVKAVKSVDLNKITYNKDGWLFLNQLWFFLKIEAKRYRKTELKHLYYDIDLLSDYLADYRDNESNIFNNEKFYIKTIISEIDLSDDKKIVFDLRLQGYTIHEIKDIVHKSYGWVHLELSKILNYLKMKLLKEYPDYINYRNQEKGW